ncbi:3274_t:CDS:2 [Entrophospora sp. SA101]|nr:3274_t:CDS:2 [Entrophospora sp. SA101]
MSVERDIRYELIARLCPNSTEAGMFAIRSRRKVASEKDFLESVNKVIKSYAKFSSTPSSLSNSFTISDKNLVIILEKKDKELEWQSLIFKYKDEDEDDVQLSIKENKEVMVERWFLTRNNVQRCSQILENESKWITSLQAKHDKNVITVNLKTNHSISKNTE